MRAGTEVGQQPNSCSKTTIDISGKVYESFVVYGTNSRYDGFLVRSYGIKFLHTCLRRRGLKRLHSKQRLLEAKLGLRQHHAKVCLNNVHQCGKEAAPCERIGGCGSPRERPRSRRTPPSYTGLALGACHRTKTDDLFPMDHWPKLVLGKLPLDMEAQLSSPWSKNQTSHCGQTVH